MRLSLRPAAAVSAVAMLLASANANAHVGIAGPAFAGTNQVITLNVGHGCEGADTVRIEVSIPKEVTTVRGLPSFFGYADVKKNEAGVVTSVVWTKADVRPGDDQYYPLQLRIAVPKTPFETLYFPTTQYCRTAAGVESSTAWNSMLTPVPEGQSPSPTLVVLPARSPGWNKYTAPKEITDLAIFNDAQIVWVGDSAYSSNPTTKEQIAAEAGVSVLTKIDAQAEIWVKY